MIVLREILIIPFSYADGARRALSQIALNGAAISAFPRK
jgi:hypothetical protein